MSPFEFLYYLGCAAKKRYALRNQKRLPCKVVSIGNMTLGGTGKTPATIALSKDLKKKGLRPCILTRGYKGKTKGPCFVSRGEGALLDEYQAGDEAVLMAEKLQGVPIVKGKKRYDAGIFAIKNLKDQNSNVKSQFLFVLDDGFQHWALFRDLDILLIDGSNPFGNRRLFPLGPLREPLAAMQRADIVVITKSDRNQKSEAGSQQMLPDGIVKEIKGYNSNAPVFFAEHRPSVLMTAAGDALPPTEIRHKTVFGFCGIGNPGSFKRTLLSLDAELKGFLTFRDHYRYSMADLQTIADSAKKTESEWIVTTEKDIMRLKRFDLPGNMASLDIEFSVDEMFYDKVWEAIWSNISM